MNDQQFELDLFPSPQKKKAAVKIDAAEASRYEEGESPDHIAQRREVARRAFIFSDAYAELGGGIQTAAEEAELGTRYGEFVDGFEPWKKDIDTAFEQFDIAKLNVPDIRKMTKEDQRLLALHFDYFADLLQGRGRILATPGSEGSPIYDEYPFENEEAAIAYGRELMRFAEAIKFSEEYDLLHAMSKELKPKTHDRDAFVAKDKKDHGEPIVVFDTRDQKLRVKRIPRHSISAAS